MKAQKEKSEKLTWQMFAEQLPDLDEFEIAELVKKHCTEKKKVQRNTINVVTLKVWF